MGSFSITHWLIVLAVVVVVFGTARLKNAGRDLGGAVKGFKDAMREGEQKADQARLDQQRTVDSTAQSADQRDKV
jgi:sec-independent protein translocase protein TatA